MTVASTTREISAVVADTAQAEFEELTTPELARISTERGVDFATALLHDRLRRSVAHADFIRDLEAIDAADAPARLSGKLLVAPAAFYREYPKFGGDGAMIRKIAPHFGLEAAVIPVNSTGSVLNNARTIARSLKNEADDSIILASLSKGGADVRVALEDAPELARKIRVWLNICGLVRGTPVSDSLMGTRWWQRGLLKGYLAYTRADRGLVGELASTPGSLLGRAVNLPALRMINVVAFPLCEHLSGNSRGRHERLARFGPNDGSTLLRDSMLEPGHTYPLWGADHFMRTPEVPALMHRLLAYTERWT